MQPNLLLINLFCEPLHQLFFHIQKPACCNTSLSAEVLSYFPLPFKTVGSDCRINGIFLLYPLLQHTSGYLEFSGCLCNVFGGFCFRYSSRFNNASVGLSLLLILMCRSMGLSLCSRHVALKITFSSLPPQRTKTVIFLIMIGEGSGTPCDTLSIT